MKVIRPWILVLASVLTLPVIAQTKPTDMQVFAQKVKADKRLVVAGGMHLTDAEAKAFWPIYDAYQKELESINKRAMNTITTYAELYKKGSVPNETARKLIDESLAVEEAEVRLKRSYVAKLDKVLPGVKVARFIQIENKVRAAALFALAEAIPLVE